MSFNDRWAPVDEALRSGTFALEAPKSTPQRGRETMRPMAIIFIVVVALIVDYSWYNGLHASINELGGARGEIRDTLGGSE